MSPLTGPTYTERLEVRPPRESDRERFCGLFATGDFMVYSLTGALDAAGANARFDRMLAVADEITFAKQPIIERGTKSIVGYAGVDFVEWRGERSIEWGYRLVGPARGKGYATEASRALLDVARTTHAGERVLGLIDPTNEASRNVLGKLGFEFVVAEPFHGRPCEFYELVL